MIHVYPPGHGASILGDQGIRLAALFGAILEAHELGGHAIRDQPAFGAEPQVPGIRLALLEPAAAKESIDLGPRRNPGAARPNSAVKRRPARPSRWRSPRKTASPRAVAADGISSSPGASPASTAAAPVVETTGDSPGARRRDERGLLASVEWGPHAKAQHRLALPIASVVSRPEAGARVARNLVSLEAASAEAHLDPLDHLGGPVFVAGLHLARREGPAEGRLRLPGQLVGRDVLGRDRPHRIEIPVEVGQRLVRRREDQIDREIVEAGAASGLESRPGGLGPVGPTEALQLSIVEGLDADRETVDAGLAKSRQALALGGWQD